MIASDLTGAGKIGSILTENNKKSFTINEGWEKYEIERLFSEYEGIVINLNARSLSPGGAYSRVKSFLETLPSIKNRLIYKKMDSTLRGNVVEEIEAILGLNCCDAVFLPLLCQNLKE